MLDPDRRYLIAYAAAAALLVVLAFQLIGGRGGSGPAPAVSMAAPAAAPRGAKARAAAGGIWVDVAGAVRRPGVYRLPEGARVADAIARAGGPARRAQLVSVNQAAKLADGQQVLVPLRGRAAVLAGAAVPAAPAASHGAPGPTAPPASGAAGAGARLSLTSATLQQLEQLDGIGPALAARIIAYRDANGGFRSVDELQEVEGIGEKRFQSLRGSVQP